MSRLRQMLVAAFVLVAGGLTLRQAITNSVRVEGYTCDDWEDLYLHFRGSVQGKALGDVLLAECPDIVLPPACSVLPGGAICHRGHIHGPGLTTDRAPGTSKADLHTCDPQVQGTPTECVRGEDEYLALVRADDRVRSAMFRKILSRIRHWELAESRGD